MIAGLWLNESGAHVKVVNFAINHVIRKRAPGLCTSLRNSWLSKRCFAEWNVTTASRSCSAGSAAALLELCHLSISISSLDKNLICTVTERVCVHQCWKNYSDHWFARIVLMRSLVWFYGCMSSIPEQDTEPRVALQLLTSVCEIISRLEGSPAT